MTCDECGRRFDDEKLFKSHTETVHGKLEKPMLKPFSCKFCPKTFSYLLNVSRHTFLVHPNAKEKPEEVVPFHFDTSNGNHGVLESQEYDQTNFIQQKPDFPELEQFKCKICGEFLKSKRYLVAHIQSHYAKLQDQGSKFRSSDEKINYLLHFYQNFMKDITFRALNTCN